MKNHRTSGRPRGFSLVEVMVAVVIISVGLLGIAKMQALAMSNTTTSRLRALAAIEAAGLASAMHSNREYWAGNAPAATTTFSSTAAPQIGSTDAALQAAANAALAAGAGVTDNIQTCVGAANGASMCGATAASSAGVINLAAFDFARWSSSLTSLLPNPAATVSCPPIAGGTAPPSCTIVITWSEKAVAMNAQEAKQQAANPNAAIEQPSYLLYVEP